MSSGMDKPNLEQEDTYQVILMPTGRRGRVKRGTNLLQAVEGLGVELESICGGRQTCGKCQVIVEDGYFPKHAIISRPDHLSPPAEQEISCCKDHGIMGRRLACAGEVLGDLLITVPEESQARKQVIAKAASDRVIVVNPALRQVYVQVEPATLGDPRGDWERLAEAIKTQWGFLGLEIDSKALIDLQKVFREKEYKVTVTLWQEKEILRVQPGYCEGVYGLAVDVGSTTIAAHLCDLRTGKVLATQASMNPQVRYGEDLMSRVSYATTEPQGLARLNRLVIRTLNELAEKAATAIGLRVDDLLDAVIVGNTVMHHILLGINPVELGRAPFTLALFSPLNIKARDIGLGLNPAARLHVLPLIAGHVGADNVGVILSESPQEQDEIMLLVDVGTNAEIVLGDRQKLLVASSPTGPAFEGAQITHGQRAAPGAIERVRINPETLEAKFRVIGFNEWIDPQDGNLIPPEARATGICGSGIIETIAEMYLAGIINSSGQFNESTQRHTARVRYQGRIGEYILVEGGLSATGSPIVITQNDVRAVQLAKAALYAGVKLLMMHRGVDRIDRIVLAGAFGSFISPFHAMVLGLIPDCDLDNVVAVGNAAGDGARMALLDIKMRQKAERLARWVDYVETPLLTSFQDEFVAALNLPHALDAFPHLDEFLPVNNSKRERKFKHRIKDLRKGAHM